MQRDFLKLLTNFKKGVIFDPFFYQICTFKNNYFHVILIPFPFSSIRSKVSMSEIIEGFIFDSLWIFFSVSDDTIAMLFFGCILFHCKINIR